MTRLRQGHNQWNMLENVSQNQNLCLKHHVSNNDLDLDDEEDDDENNDVLCM